MTPVCFTVDVEGDSAHRQGSSLTGTRLVLPRLLALFSKHGVSSTLFIQEDHLVQAGSRFTAMLLDAQEAGHEIGLHTHGLIDASPDAAGETIETGARRLRSLGFDVLSFRAGRYHLDPRVVRTLQECGILYDSSVMPGLSEHSAEGKERCNHLGAPIAPYILDMEDHRAPGNSDVVEIPINRYPNVHANKGYKLTGARQEPLFDYFYGTRRDEVIVVDMHSWDGLSDIAKRIGRSGRFGALADMCGRIAGSSRLIDRRYPGAVEDLIRHIKETADAEFVTIREAGRRYRNAFGMRHSERPGHESAMTKERTNDRP